MILGIYNIDLSIAEYKALNLFCKQIAVPIKLIYPGSPILYDEIAKYNPIFIILFGLSTIKSILPKLKHIPSKMGWLVKHEGYIFYLCADPLTIQKTNQTLGILKGHIKRLNTIILPKFIMKERLVENVNG